MKTNNIGGARSKSGRKPVDDPKEPITVYLHASTIEKIGGKDKCREAILAFISKF